MKLEPNEYSSLETECLYGETVKVIKNEKDWVYCVLLTDNYHGWIKKSNLGHLEEPTHRVINKRSFVYVEQSPKSNCLHYLPLGAKLAVKNLTSIWAEIFLPKSNKFEVGYVPRNHIVKISDKINDWVSIAEQLVGVPYKWGGRDTLGIDCSALLQLSYENSGEIIPRNTADQVKVSKEIIEDINELSRGCVVFWKGHVSIMVDKVNCIHSNAFHMSTIIEPLDVVISRMKGQDILRMLNFNNY